MTSTNYTQVIIHLLTGMHVQPIIIHQLINHIRISLVVNPLFGNADINQFMVSI